MTRAPSSAVARAASRPLPRSPGSISTSSSGSQCDSRWRYSQFVLLDQPSIRDNNVTIGQLITQATAKTGENIQIGRFVRFRVGDAE